MGPHSTSLGNKYILFAKVNSVKVLKPVLCPIPKKQNEQAKTMARKIVERCIVRFGFPVNLHSQRGSNFMSHLYHSLVVLAVN